MASLGSRSWEANKERPWEAEGYEVGAEESRCEFGEALPEFKANPTAQEAVAFS